MSGAGAELEPAHQHLLPPRPHLLLQQQPAPTVLGHGVNTDIALVATAEVTCSLRVTVCGCQPEAALLHSSNREPLPRWVAASSSGNLPVRDIFVKTRQRLGKDRQGKEGY